MRNSVLTGQSSLILWQDVIKGAELRCGTRLDPQLEVYLIALLIRYTDNPQLAKQVFAITFLDKVNLSERERLVTLQLVGDKCLLYAGLFPQVAQQKHVKISYFVDLGRAAYAMISTSSNDLYYALACRFVELMDILQSIKEVPDLLPLEAYEQWNEVGSRRALQILKSYSNAIPLKKLKD